ncbi:hypothetical protein LTR35_012366 [Friedmanniomyces endolithicus]|uniref:SWIM-type domain-containing protein n=1 Tax=Friedmanniomyces endolithicus TaxID=329885 RepID=A0AAN6J3A3_9PEZI|nr:hypothetical protein LTR35_012366 [Friedmanniomyces endolithicus]KAK0281386.1 hypothetical protein LTS00_012595 [Friedmanniomyces endolithicus]KAK0313401.1 hypothetical protein LTR82_013432 [Friedmanniomyces endolithicus]KAK1015248.1 hypothetical protein LTR54_003791 [Friedmanniomyces endolithicus]
MRPGHSPHVHRSRISSGLRIVPSRGKSNNMASLQDGLPTARHFISSTVSALRKPTVSSSNPLTDEPTCKELLLTLHVLFPNELLPALDLLDRGLVTSLQLSRPGDPFGCGTSSGRNEATTEPAQQQDPVPAFDGIESDIGQTRDAATAPTGRASSRTYYVRSARQQQFSRHTTSRFRNAAYEQTTYYEVRLNAWSCSCPAFAFFAFPATLSDDHDRNQNHSHSDMSYGGKESPSWNFGGLSQGTDMPVCKHLLACAFVEHSSMFADMVEERTVSMGEMAGWAAGWGD